MNRIHHHEESRGFYKRLGFAEYLGVQRQGLKW